MLRPIIKGRYVPEPTKHSLEERQETMNWDAIGALGELISAFAVLATLVYLSVQVRQAKNSIRDNARTARFQADMDLLLHMSGNNYFNSAAGKLWSSKASPDFRAFEYALTTKYKLSEEEAISFNTWCFAWLKFQEHCFLQPLSKEDRLMHDSQISGWFQLPALIEFWTEENKTFLDDRFISHVEGLLKR